MMEERREEEGVRVHPGLMEAVRRAEREDKAERDGGEGGEGGGEVEQ